MTHDIAAAPRGPDLMVDSVLLAITRVSTFHGTQSLTGATGFFFRRAGRLFLVTSRHVLSDPPSGHLPDRLEIELHTDAQDLTQLAVFSMPLRREGGQTWRQMSDSWGVVDIAAIQIEEDRLPAGAVMECFDETHLQPGSEEVGIGDFLSIIGYPLGFHDTVHHLAVARSASIASAYGVRFQKSGYFLTDARTHRGSSGAPVLRRRAAPPGETRLPWLLLGVHSTRMDMRSRDLVADESLGLNCAWYADALLALTS